jgi:rsbT antagonist protein RsbS
MSSVSTTERIPLIRLRRYLLVSIQVALTDRMVLQLKDDISRALVRSDAKGLIIDVSGIDVMDSFIARAIRDIGLISQLMGVETAVCGIDPMIALTLVEMGMELKSVSTTRNLDAALEQLDQRLEKGLRDEEELLAQSVADGAGQGPQALRFDDRDDHAAIAAILGVAAK